MNPICVDCQREMFCAKTGRVIEVRVVDDNDNERPYQLVRADEFTCRACGSSVMIPAKEPWIDAGAQPKYYEDTVRHERSTNNLRLVRVR